MAPKIQFLCVQKKFFKFFSSFGFDLNLAPLALERKLIKKKKKTTWIKITIIRKKDFLFICGERADHHHHGAIERIRHEDISTPGHLTAARRNSPEA